MQDILDSNRRKEMDAINERFNQLWHLQVLVDPDALNVSDHAREDVQNFSAICEELIGFPNAGKSSLLKEITSANPKIASYPFTTLEPNLGELNTKIIADIPGLIEGASKGKGLGIKFLKHIERVSLLFHCISCELEEPGKSYHIIRDELKAYNPKLLDIPEIILLTKTDLKSEKEIKSHLNVLKNLKKQVLAVSIHDWDSLEKLKLIILTHNERLG